MLINISRIIGWSQKLNIGKPSTKESYRNFLVEENVSKQDYSEILSKFKSSNMKIFLEDVTMSKMIHAVFGIKLNFSISCWAKFSCIIDLTPVFLNFWLYSRLLTYYLYFWIFNYILTRWLYFWCIKYFLTLDFLSTIQSRKVKNWEIWLKNEMTFTQQWVVSKINQ